MSKKLKNLIWVWLDLNILVCWDQWAGCWTGKKLKQSTLDESEKKISKEHFIQLRGSTHLKFHSMASEHLSLTLCVRSLASLALVSKSVVNISYERRFWNKCMVRLSKICKKKSSWNARRRNTMIDVRTDTKHGNLMNPCMHCQRGTCFIKYVED